MRRYFHVLGTERAKRALPHDAFAQSGDLVSVDACAAHVLAEGTPATPAEVAALALLHEVLHVVVSRHESALAALVVDLTTHYGEGARKAAIAFVTKFPPPPVFDGTMTPVELVDSSPERFAWACEEILLWWVSSQNPAYRKLDAVAGWSDVPAAVTELVERATLALSGEPSGIVPSESLLESLLAPARASTSVFEQLAWLEARWGLSVTKAGRRHRVLFGQDLDGSNGLAPRVTDGHLAFLALEGAHDASDASVAAVTTASLRAEPVPHEAERGPSPNELDALCNDFGGAPSVEELLAATGFGNHDRVATMLDSSDALPSEERLGAAVVEDDSVVAHSQVRILEQGRDHGPEAHQQAHDQ